MVGDGRVSVSSEIHCKRCKNKVVAFVKCITCDSCYHTSCAKNSKCEFIDNTYIRCCDVSQDKLMDEETNNKFFVAMENLASLTDSKIDINIFKYVLKHKDVIITELREKIRLLEDKLSARDSTDTKKINAKNINIDEEETSCSTAFSNPRLPPVTADVRNIKNTTTKSIDSKISNHINATDRKSVV